MIPGINLSRIIAVAFVLGLATGMIVVGACDALPWLWHHLSLK